MSHLYAYGTLRHPDVWSRVVQGRYRSLPTVLHGYTALRVRDADYPGLVKHEDLQVEGIVYLDVSESDLRRLDLFEGEEYLRIEVQPVDMAGNLVDAQTYLYNPEYPHRLEDAPWNYDEFERIGRQRFLPWACTHLVK